MSSSEEEHQQQQQQLRSRSVNDFDTVEGLREALQSPHFRTAFSDCSSSTPAARDPTFFANQNEGQAAEEQAAVDASPNDESMEASVDASTEGPLSSELDWVLTNYNAELSQTQSLRQELKRLQCLKSYLLLDSDRESSFERLTALTARMFKVPIALVSLVDLGRQWFMSNRGLPPDVRETPRRLAFCAHAILSTLDLFVINDASTDVRFQDSPLVVGPPYIRFYAGAPLTCPEGYKLGTLCIIDVKPRHSGLSLEEKQNLRELAAMVVDTMVERKQQLDKTLQDKSQLIACTAHDLLTPLNGVQMSVSLLLEDEDLQKRLSDNQKELLATASSCTNVMNRICQHAMESFRKQHHDSHNSSLSLREPMNDAPAAASSGSGSDDGPPSPSCSSDKRRGLGNRSTNNNNTIVIQELIQNLQMVMEPYPKSVPLYMTVEPNVPAVLQVKDDLKVFRSAVNYLTNACAKTVKGSVHLHISVRRHQQKHQQQEQQQQAPSDRSSLNNNDDNKTRAQATKSSLLFECRDTGPGVPLELYPLLFRPFRRDARHSDQETVEESCHDTMDAHSAKASSSSSSLALCSTISNVNNSGLGLYSVATQIGSIGGDYGFRPRRDAERGVDSDSGAIFWFSIPLVVPSSKDEEEAMARLGGMAGRKHQRASFHDLPEVAQAQTVQLSKQADQLALRIPNLSASLSSSATAPTTTAATSSSPQNQKQDSLPPTQVHNCLDGNLSLFSNGLPESMDATDTDAVAKASLMPATPTRIRSALVIDDSIVIRKSLSRALTKLGFHVQSAMNGLDGLKDLQTDVYDVVFCDFLMPVMDGLDCVQQYRDWEAIHRPWIHQYIVGISAHASRNDVNKGLSVGMDGFRAKPITLQVLKELEGSPELKEVSKVLDSVMGPGANHIVERRRDLSKRDDESHHHADKRTKKNDGPVCLVGEATVNVSKSMSRIMESKHWNPVFVNDGEDALRLLKMRNWDAVFLDEEMPRLDGIRVIERFREWESENRVARQKNVVLISQSFVPNPNNGSLSAAYPNGFDGALGKPILPADLVKLLDTVSFSITSSSDSCDIVTR